MTIMSELKRLLDKASEDADFRARLFKEPLAAAACLGVVLSAAQVAVLKDLHARVADAAIAQAAFAPAPLSGLGPPFPPRLLPQPLQGVA